MAGPGPRQRATLLQLNTELLQATVLQHLDGRSLAALECTCRAFRALAPRGLRVTEAVAREQLIRRCGGSLQEAERWRYRSWKERLYIEDAAVGFQKVFAADAGFAITEPGEPRERDGVVKVQKRLLVELSGMGPKLLVSDATTGTHGTLRWRLRVRGNTAVEFGVVPADHCARHGTLHKVLCPPDRDAHRPGGFCSQITAGSNLSLKASVMRNSIVELVARPRRLEVLLNNLQGEKEMHWVNGHPVSRLYRGPEQLRFEIDLPTGYDLRLALTAWAKGAFEVLHELPKHPGAAPAKPLPCGSPRMSTARADSSSAALWDASPSAHPATALDSGSWPPLGRHAPPHGKRHADPRSRVWERTCGPRYGSRGAAPITPAAPVTPQAPSLTPPPHASASRRGSRGAGSACAPSHPSSALLPDMAVRRNSIAAEPPSAPVERGDSRDDVADVEMDSIETSSSSSSDNRQPALRR